MRKLFALLFMMILGALLTSSVFAAGEPVAVAKIEDGVVSVDGDLSDWGGISAYWISSKWLADAQDVTNDDDLSAFCMMAYDTNNFYFAFRVFDDVLIMEQQGATIWKNDSIEFWVHRSGLSAALVDGQPFFRDKHNIGIADSSATVTLVPAPAGYIVEAVVPLTVMAKAIGAPVASGTTMFIAFGVNDEDTSGGQRAGQIFFPRGRKDWIPDTTFAIATFQ